MLTCDKLGTPATAISSTFARNYTKLLNSLDFISSTLARSLHPLHNFKKNNRAAEAPAPPKQSLVLLPCRITSVMLTTLLHCYASIVY